MFCSKCGAKINDNTNFCSDCGTKTANVAAQQTYNKQEHIVGLGYSEKINDPKFKNYLKNSNKWSGIFSIIIAVAAIIGFYIYGENSSEMGNPEALYIGFGIGGMFMLIALFQIIGRKKSKTWDGRVVDKRSERKRRQRGANNEDYYMEDYILYTVYIQSDSGKKTKISVENDNTIYNYYQIGDRVRHHAGLNSFEKYDKTRDSIIFCNACASLNDINNDVCFRCKCPLLK